MPVPEAGSAARVQLYGGISHSRRRGGVLPINKTGCRLGGFAASASEKRMIGRQRARGVGPGGVAGQREGLAAATAPVDLAPFAGTAGLGHPPRPAELRERWGMIPDLGEACLGDSRKPQTRQGLRRVTRQHPARRRDIQETPAPAAHARLRTMRVIVRNDIVDDETAGEPRPRRFDRRRRLVELLPARQQRGPVGQRPAIVQP